jgi:hypothetical protein
MPAGADATSSPASGLGKQQEGSAHSLLPSLVLSASRLWTQKSSILEDSGAGTIGLPNGSENSVAPQGWTAPSEQHNLCW